LLQGSNHKKVAKKWLDCPTLVCALLGKGWGPLSIASIKKDLGQHQHRLIANFCRAAIAKIVAKKAPGLPRKT